VNGTAMCNGNIAQVAFRWALCSCTKIRTSGGIFTDGYDSTKTGYVPGGLGAGLGANELLSASGPTTIGGTLWSGGPVDANNRYIIGQELHVNGHMYGVNMSVGTDGFVTGDMTGVDVKGKLHVPASATLTRVTYGSVVREPVTVPPPCDCSPSQLIPVADIVAAHQNDNDNASIGLAANATVNPSGPIRIDLPCGRYYLDGIQSSHPITIVAHGRTALYVKNGISQSGSLSITVDPTGELDIFLAEKVSASGTTRFGSPSHPALSRFYIQAPTLADFSYTHSGGTTVGAFLYGRNRFSASGTSELYGGVFMNDFDASGDSIIHYDRAILRAGAGCGSKPTPTPTDAGVPPTPTTCNSCQDCGNQACINGACGACRTSADCCAPLVCFNGHCDPVID
jgi:hypothetical protein